MSTLSEHWWGLPLLSTQCIRNNRNRFGAGICSKCVVLVPLIVHETGCAEANWQQNINWCTTANASGVYHSVYTRNSIKLQLLTMADKLKSQLSRFRNSAAARSIPFQLHAHVCLFSCMRALGFYCLCAAMHINFEWKAHPFHSSFNVRHHGNISISLQQLSSRPNWIDERPGCEKLETYRTFLQN